MIVINVIIKVINDSIILCINGILYISKGSDKKMTYILLALHLFAFLHIQKNKQKTNNNKK